MRLTFRSLPKACLRTLRKCVATLWHAVKSLRLPSGPPFVNLPQTVNTGFFFAGLALLVLSLTHTWIEVPEFLQQTREGYSVITREADSTIFFQILIALSLTVGTCGYALRILANKQLIQIMSILLACLCFFPASIMHVSPDLASLAGWIERQHDNLTWLGGDIYTAQEEAFFDFRQNLYIVDPPAQSGIVSIPHSIPYLMQFSLISEFASWLGYSDAFTLFVSSGWIFALTGALLLSFTMIRRTWNFDLMLFRVFVKYFAITFLSLLIVSAIPIAVAAHHISRSNQALNRHDYAASYRHLNTACRILPVLAEESIIISQRSLLAKSMNLDNPETHHYQAIVLEQEGFKNAAEQLFNEIMADPKSTESLRREARRGLLRQAIHRINSQQFERAYILLRRLMLQEPCALKANYALQFTCLQTGRYQEVAKLDRMLTATYSKIHALNKKALLSFSHKNNALAQYLAGDLDEALDFHQRSIHP